jgi:AcrR family transcriptional regulator
MGFEHLDTKQSAILGSAMAAFSTYGFKKTSMDDIARGANMSRPALYLHYRNKEEIFRSMVEGYYIQALGDVRAALVDDPSRSIADILADAFSAQGGDYLEPMMKSAHGMELLESTAVVAQDLIEKGEAALSEIYVVWLTSQAKAGRINPAAPPEHMARLIYATLKGIKHTATDFPSYSREVRVFADMMGMSLTASQSG